MIENKLESLRRCIRRIESKRPARVDALVSDDDVQDVIALNLIRAVQICVDIAMHITSRHELPPPDTMAGAFLALHQIGVLDEPLAQRMGKAVGFRNIAVHAYRDIDWRIVFSIIHDDLDDFTAFARAVRVHEELE